MEQWFKHIQSRIISLNYKSIKLSNKYLHKNEKVRESEHIKDQM